MQRMYQVLFFVLLFSAIHAAHADTITLVADKWCPYNCQPDTEKPGFLVEIAQAVFEKRGHTVKYIVLPWARAIEETRSGKYVGILGAYRSDAPDFVFPETPLAFGGSFFYVLPSTEWKFSGIESLEKISVGIIRDYSYGKEMDVYIKTYANDPTRVQVMSGDDALEKNVGKLLSGRVGAVLEDPSVMRHFLAERKLVGKVVEAGALEMNGVFIGFSPNLPKSREYAEQLTGGYRELERSGELRRILAKYAL